MKIPIVVTTCPKNEHLIKDFKILFDKFCGLPFVVDVSEPGESKARQLYRITSRTKSDFLLILEEDFYFVKPVDVGLLQRVSDFCEKHSVDRFTLQSKNAYAHSDWLPTSLEVAWYSVYQAPKEVRSLFGFDATIWKVSFVRRWLEWFVGYYTRTVLQNDRGIEVNISNRLREEDVPTRVYALAKSVMDYRDAMRGGNTEIELHHDPLRLTVKPGKELALYPQGDRKETELLL